jgi:hypothetical protein
VLDAEGYQVLGIWTSEQPDAPGHAICRREREVYFAKVAPADARTVAGRRLHNEMVMTCAFVERGRRGELAHRIAAPVDVGYTHDTAYLVQQHIPGSRWSACCARRRARCSRARYRSLRQCTSRVRRPWRWTPCTK